MEDVKGLSKKELNKLARKEKKKTGAQPTPENSSATLSLSFCKSSYPELSRVIDLFGKDSIAIKYFVNDDSTDGFQLPFLVDQNNQLGSIAGDANISKYLTLSNESTSYLYPSKDNWLSAQVDQWLDFYTMSLVSPTVMNSTATTLNTHLLDKTYLVGDSLSLADICMVLLVKKIDVKTLSTDLFPHVHRWFKLIFPQLPAITPAPAIFQRKETKTDQPTGKTAAAKTSGKGGEAIVVDDSTGTCPPLEDAEEGKVCTRFPPEPSGYLHIGHTKAVLLNQYYAQRYKGRLLVRFDDTNPSKEKEEFEENIIQDLATLGVIPDQVSHTSDHFKTCEKFAIQMIKDGLAYMDSTDQEFMQAERMAKKNSKFRDSTVEHNLKLFERLLSGEFYIFCLRVKIDMQSVNGTMRDPVLYRYNELPHHRTGTKFKAYPTYDFACPIVDSIEGVTHALRTTEYNDRDEQYHWIQNALKIRKVHIMAFGKMNFIHTVLSKRKLTWFVENNFVEGWFDPRFPTVQGCVRRGMNVEALKNFILSQGASRRVITMEWDKFWSENKKVMEEIAPRFMGVSVQDMVELEVVNGPKEISAHSVQVHPQKPEFGTRVMRRFKKVYLDQIDAGTFSVGQEITLLRWGNVTISEIKKSDDQSTVISLKGTYDPAATNFSKTKKITWIAAIPDLVPCKLVEFDHLITKAKLADDEDFKDFANLNSRSESDALCDPCLRGVNKGDIIQLERKGFFRCDVAYGGVLDKPAVLFAIPDGKVSKTAASADATGKSKKK